MFDERLFILAKEQQWRDLSSIVDQVRMSGLKSLPHQDLLRFGSLYRRACSDLAYTRSQKATPGLIDYLNQLVGITHGLLYTGDQEKSGIGAIWKFYLVDFPAVAQKRAAFIWAAVGITIIGALIAYFLILSNPKTTSLFIPEAFKSSVDAWKKGFADHGDISAGDGAIFSASLMTHNTQVGIVAFATGVTVVMPPVLLFGNGTMLGALVAVVAPTGKLMAMWAGLLPHGVCELSAIFICGAAGMLLGWAIIAPGELTRRDALLVCGRDAITLMLGTIPLFIIAGIFEANVSHSSLPRELKFALAIFQLILLLYYLGFRKANNASEAARV